MDIARFDWFTRVLGASTGRRSLLHGAVSLGTAILGAVVLPHAADAKEPLCLKNGSRCTKKSRKCKARHCLKTPFTIEARWNNPASDHDSYLFVPNKTGENLPFPYIDYDCNSEQTDNGALYPFAFVSQDAAGPGDEVTTVRKLRKGKYEYWIELAPSAPTGDLTVDLRGPSGRIMRSWVSPENPSGGERGWHVFDIRGGSGSIASVDQLSDSGTSMPAGAHNPNTDVCPA